MWEDLVGAAVKVVDLLSRGAAARVRLGIASTTDTCREARCARTEVVVVEGDAGHRCQNVSFEFAGTELTPAERDEFRSRFCQALIGLDKWAAGSSWPAIALPDLCVRVSDRYEISKSLVPAWSGLAGHLEFPARRVRSGQAAIMHELVHVAFPNGNRFLAEGLAVYVQAAIGTNPAFPNFGRPLHDVARDQLLAAAVSGADQSGLDQIELAELDAMATPNRLMLRIGREGECRKRRGATFTYPIAGSFVQFLIETRGMDAFRALYARTPFVPHMQTAGAPRRWLDVFGLPLAAIEDEWKSMLLRVPRSNGRAIDSSLQPNNHREAANA